MKHPASCLAAFFALAMAADAHSQNAPLNAPAPRLKLSVCSEPDKALCFTRKLPEKDAARIKVPPVNIPDRKIPTKIELKYRWG